MVFYYNRSAAAAAASRRLLQQNATLEAATYILNQSYVRQPVAERWCADQGGHLVSYHSLEEQVGLGWVWLRHECMVLWSQAASGVSCIHPWHWVCYGVATASSRWGWRQWSISQPQDMQDLCVHVLADMHHQLPTAASTTVAASPVLHLAALLAHRWMWSSTSSARAGCTLCSTSGTG
jgi:hypothetical protein